MREQYGTYCTVQYIQYNTVPPPTSAQSPAHPVRPLPSRHRPFNLPQSPYHTVLYCTVPPDTVHVSTYTRLRSTTPDCAFIQYGRWRRHGVASDDDTAPQQEQPKRYPPAKLLPLCCAAVLCCCAAVLLCCCAAVLLCCCAALPRRRRRGGVGSFRGVLYDIPTAVR